MKKMIEKKKIVFIGIVLCLLIIGGRIIAGYYQNVNKDQKNMYLALQYLGMNDYEMASAYLEKIGANTSNKMEFAKSSAEIIEQKLIGNDNLYTIKLDIISEDFGKNEEQNSIIDKLKNIDSYTTGYADLINEIIDYMKISEKNKERYQKLFDIEYLAMYGGYVEEAQLQEYALLSGDNSDNLELMAALNRGDYYSALQSAAGRVKEEPSAKNRLLLADVLATAVYAGYTLDETVFYQTLGEEYDQQEIEEKRLKRQEEVQVIQEKIAALQNQINVETDGAKTTELNQKITELYEQQEELAKQGTYSVIYKAMNSIMNITSAEAEIVEAKLYYVLEQGEQAVNTLIKASDSVVTKFSSNETVKQGLDLINKLHNGEIASSVSKTEEAGQMLEEMFASVNDIPVRNTNSYYTVSLAEALSSSVLAEYKYQNNEIYISDIDDSQYPDISFSITAREEILKDILNKNNCIIKDTHHEVEYAAETEEEVDATICFVVDISGSMSGEPLNNAKKALVSFADTLETGAEISLVSFDDVGKIVTPVTTDINRFMNDSNALAEGGGTDIGAGIYCGIEALQEASGTKNIILMTDGQSDIDNAIINTAIQEGVTIFTVGFGSVNQELLQQIADETGGSFTLADSSNDLANVYESVAALIGSRVKITYTVSENPEEMPRYVYVNCENFNTSKKQEYRSDVEVNKTLADDFIVYNSLTYVLGNEWTNEDGLVEGVLQTTQNTGILSLEIAGQTIVPTISEAGIINGPMAVKIAMSPLTQEGIYDVVFHFEDGSRYQAENVILVYQRDKVIHPSMVKIGSVYLSANQAVWLSDEKMALAGNISIYNVPEYDERTLTAYTNNILILEGFEYSEQRSQKNNYFYYDWGEKASFTLDGVISLNGIEARYITSGQAQISAAGKLKGEINSEQCVITKRQEAEKE